MAYDENEMPNKLSFILVYACGIIIVAILLALAVSLWFVDFDRVSYPLH